MSHSHAKAAAPHQHPGSCHGQHAHNAQHEHSEHHAQHEHEHGAACCAPAIAAGGASALAPSQPHGAYLRTELRITQMDCPTEQALITRALGGRSEIHALEFDLMRRVLTVVHDPDGLAQIIAAIKKLGFTPETAATPAAIEPRKPWWPLAAAAVAAIAAEAAHWLQAPWFVAALLALAAVLGSGLGTYKKGLTALRHGEPNINALMSIAVTGALIIGQWAEAAMVMVLYTLAERIEALSLDRARHAVQSLLTLAPEQATVLQADGSWQPIALGAIAPGARFRVRPGERIALDGTIAAGSSSVDQSPITGESLPIDKTVGDPVYAGSINGATSLEIISSASASQSTLARIIKAIESAQGKRAPTQRFVDKFARVYTPIVVLFALAVAIAPPLLGYGGWYDWVYKALVLLVIACPCALVISTPVTVVSGLAAGARHGVLIKGGVYLEQARRLRWLALDKTGTLTHGRPSLTDRAILAGDLAAANPQSPPATGAGLAEPQIHALAAAMAARSDHPVSRAIAAALGSHSFALEDFSALAGRGTQARLQDKTIILGNHRLIHERGLCSAALEARLLALEQQGKTVVMLADDSQVLALYAVADTLKPESAAALKILRAMGVNSVMLSGDNSHTVAAIAAQLGMEAAHGDLLPEDKLRVIDELAASGAAVGMVGDGINDSPALARADIGFAMGAIGTDTAMQTADVALMDDDLRKIPWFLQLSARTHAILVQNISLALGIKAVFLALTVAGLGTMWMAVFADVGASLLVVANGLRILKRHP